jgi:hypothetical protein
MLVFCVLAFARRSVGTLLFAAAQMDLSVCPFLALSMQQRAANSSKRRHKAKVDNRRILRGMEPNPATSSTPPQRAANVSFSAC